jgi:hypothetical protein
MSELKLAPLHAALRELRVDDAVREAASLIGATQPSATPAAPAPATQKQDALAMARAIEALVGQHRPDMAKGRWIYEWLVDRVWPDADLLAILLDLGPGAKPRELLLDERFRRAIGANEHDEATWFNRERFGKAVDVLALPRPAELRRAAEKAGFRLDEFEKALAAPPKRASTRKPSRPEPKQPGKPATKGEATASKTSRRSPPGSFPE